MGTVSYWSGEVGSNGVLGASVSGYGFLDEIFRPQKWEDVLQRRQLRNHLRLYKKYGIPVPQELIDSIVGRQTLKKLRG